MILTNFYNRTPKITTKIIIQLLAILSFADIIWIIFFSGAWTHLSKEERAKSGDNDSEDVIQYWDSLWFIHGFVYFLSFVELILKLLLLYYLIVDYKGKYSLEDLLNLNYDETNNDDQAPINEQNQNNNISNDIEGFGQEIGTNSFEENFRNDYE